MSKTTISKKDNLLMLSADSFVYFKQLLKLYYKYDGQFVRPYIVLAYLLSTIGEISKDEFTYLLPLAINKDRTEKIVKYIYEIRNGYCSIDDALLNILFEMENYREAQEIFLAADVVDEALIMEVGMNRKSRSYDIPYTALYEALVAFRRNKNIGTVMALYEATDKLYGSARLYWKTYLFNTISKRRVETEGLKRIHRNRPILTVSDEVAFKREFIRLLHLFKAKSTLNDYYDLNKRYFKTTDTVIFQDNKVRLDIIPACYFSLVKDRLLDIAFSPVQNLGADCSLGEISEGLSVSRSQIIQAAKKIYGVELTNLLDVSRFVEQERYERLNEIIDSKFTDEAIVELLTLFEKRNDDEIQRRVTVNADVPTIFEYVLAIVWYKISNRQGKVLDYMNLSLDSDLLPITHAVGGHEDITYYYEATEAYPAHTLLIEATLAGGTNQRRMEMEPVSRHLGDYLLSHKGEEAYCLFATTYLNINVVSDFRIRKNGKYYSSDGSKSVSGIKIIPCQTSELKTIVKSGITYEQLYKIFEKAYRSDTEPNEWYQKHIVRNLV